MDLPTLTNKDEDDLTKWGLINDIDFIAASFVRKGSDVVNIRKVSMFPSEKKKKKCASRRHDRSLCTHRQLSTVFITSKL